jgi:tail assembly chaperone
MTTLKELEKSGSFVADKPVKKSISYSLDGQEYTAEIFIKELGIGEREALFTEADDDKSRMAKIISRAVLLGEDGKERISYDYAYRIKGPLGEAMISAFNEVNAPKKPLPGTNDSSATSA